MEAEAIRSMLGFPIPFSLSLWVLRPWLPHLFDITVGNGNSLGTISQRVLSTDGTTGGHFRPGTTIYDSADNEISFTTGTAGTPAGGVSSVQGVAGMTPLATTPFLPRLPVSF